MWRGMNLGYSALRCPFNLLNMSVTHLLHSLGYSHSNPCLPIVKTGTNVATLGTVLQHLHLQMWD
jgi:hypothetical protein